MPQGDKSAYTDKQKRMARHIETSYEKRGVSEGEAAARAWATVNKETGGGKLSGSGRGTATETRTAAARSAAAKKAAAQRSPEARSASAKQAAATRKRNAAAKN